MNGLKLLFLPPEDGIFIPKYETFWTEVTLMLYILRVLGCFINKKYIYLIQHVST